VSLVSIGGRKVIHGGNGLAKGPVDSSRLPQIMEAVHSRKFGHAQQLNALYVQ
jgi:urease